MRAATFAGAVALGYLSLTVVSAEIIGTASAQQRVTGASRHVAALTDRAAAPAPSQAGAVAAAEAPGAASEAPPVALVIGNAAYPDDNTPMTAPVNDARAMTTELKARGFDVETGENVTKQTLDRAIERFAAKIKPGSTALLFYSGYSVQLGRESFLIPVSAQIWRPEDVRRDAVALDGLIAEMNARGAKTKLVIVDASRRNPFERRLRGFSTGLAPIAGPEGTLALSAVAPGKFSDEATGDTSVFARELINQIRTPGATAEEAFNRTRTTVARATGGQQVPAVFSATTDDFYFSQPQAAAPTRQSAR